MGTKLQHVHFPMHDHYQVQHENKILHKTQFSLLGELVRIEKMRAPQAKKVDVLMKKIKYLGHEYNKNLVLCHYICPIQCLQKINGEFFGVLKKFLLCKKKSLLGKLELTIQSANQPVTTAMKRSGIILTKVKYLRS